MEGKSHIHIISSNLLDTRFGLASIDIGIVLLKIHCHYFNNPVRLSPDTQLFSISLCLVMSGHCQYYLSFLPSGHKLHFFRCTFVDKWNVEPSSQNNTTDEAI